MPFVLLLLVTVPLLLVLAVAMVPVGLVMRYRFGTARQRARGWLTTLNVIGASISLTLLLVSAAVASYWAPRSIPAVALGGVVGGLLGLAGLRLSRWEHESGRLHFTPNRLLVLALILLVVGRIGYNLYRAWSLRAGVPDDTWLAAVGAAESMGVGAVFLGYTLAYWLGVRRRLRRLA